MGLSLVNSTPSDEALKPGDLVQFSIKSDGAHVDLTSLDAKFGLSRLVHNGQLPEEDSALGSFGTVALHAPERLYPATGECRRSINEGRLVISKESNDIACAGVYEYTVPVEKTNPSTLVSLRVRRWPWTDITPAFNPVASAAAPVFGLRSSFFQTNCLVALRDNGAGGSVVLSGVYVGLNLPRAVLEADFPWVELENGKDIELWIYINSTGLPSDYGLGAYSPIVEVWGKLPTDAGPRVLIRTTIVSLGTSPVVDDGTATIVFGNGGAAGDVVDVADWAIYPDFRQSVMELTSLQNHSMLVVPDAPVSYQASSGKFPTAVELARWSKLSGRASLTPDPSFDYQIGRRASPLHTVLDKYRLNGEERVPTSGRMGYERVEPRLTTRADGFMVESLLSAFARRLETECSGVGIGVQDGARAFRALLYKSSVLKTVALQISTNGDIIDAQNAARNGDGSLKEIDWEASKLLRLAVDRQRDKVTVWCDEEKIIEQSLAGLPRATQSAVEVGHILDVPSDATASIANVNYVTNYRSFEASDGLHPTNAASPFVDKRTDGYSLVEGGVLKVAKKSIHRKRSHHLFTRDEGIGSLGGALIDFRARCPIFWDKRGTPLGGESETGVGLELYLGSERLQLGFYNCGTHGKKVGILPGSGSAKDIIDQTALGAAFSAECDWTKMQNFRVVYRAFDSIKVWVGPYTNNPAIVIPWQNNGTGFDLPTDFASVGFGFGHFGGDTASESEWESLRWGFSSGYEVALSQSYPAGVRHDQYGGRHLLFVDFSE